MSAENISEWVGQAKRSEQRTPARKEVTVVRREPEKSRGAQIMELADRLRPFLTELFKGHYMKDGILIQPAHIRGLALDVADNLLKQEPTGSTASA